MALARKPSLRMWQGAMLAALIAVLGLFFAGLGRDVSFIPSPLVGRAAPQFTLPQLGSKGDMTLDQFSGVPVIINFWASWCSACRQEHALLIGLGKRFAGDGRVRLVGINYKDSQTGALRFLDSHGAFPYPSAADRIGSVGLDFGVYGLPETYFLDAAGKVVAKHIGPLTEEVTSRNLTLLGVTP
jgi:cytochrome c biogenesis protein CcmG, thiol:disulfide interchange protein DsbE